MTSPSPDVTQLQYPIGKFHWTGSLTPPQRAEHIEAIATAPRELRHAVRGLSAEQLATPYRPGGWTVAQLVHHVPESHMNAYIRFKWALTEDAPLIKAYEEKLWAETPGAHDPRIEPSLRLLESLHERWVTLLREMSEKQWAAEYRHPELGAVPLTRALGLYAWHGRHHTAHITDLRQRMGWN